MGKKAGTSSSLYPLLVLPLLLAAVACSDETLSLFFDIPPPSEVEPAPATQAPLARPVAGAPTADEGERPEIESILVWEEAEALLPKDDIDEVDWMAALREGIIKPRKAIDGAAEPPPLLFKFDFFLPGPDPSFDARFPHSVHTQWLTCESCHPAIFPMRHTEIVMDDIFEGKYCGTCHGVVAFALDSCTRCHTAMEE